MVVSFVVAVGFRVFDPLLDAWQELVIGVSITTAAWVTATLLTPPADDETLDRFCRLINPGGPGWRRVYKRLAADGSAPGTDGVNIPRGIACMFLGCLAIIFATINVVGGFMVTDRMLEMFKKK